MQPPLLSSPLIAIGLKVGGSGHDEGGGPRASSAVVSIVERGRGAAVRRQPGGKRYICQVPQ